MGETTVKTDKAPKKNWSKGLKAEFKKIMWPDKKSLTKQTVAVVTTSIALGLMIKVLDVIMEYGINFLMSL